MVQSGKLVGRGNVFAKGLRPELASRVEFYDTIQSRIEYEDLPSLVIIRNGNRIPEAIRSDDVGASCCRIGRVIDRKPSIPFLIEDVLHQDCTVHDAVGCLGDDEVPGRRKYHDAGEVPDVGNGCPAGGPRDEIAERGYERVTAIEPEHSAIGVDEARIIRPVPSDHIIIPRQDSNAGVSPPWTRRLVPDHPLMRRTDIVIGKV